MIDHPRSGEEYDHGREGPVLAASAVVLLPTALIVLATQRCFIRIVVQGSVKE